jgi:hypothetical protein
MRGLLLVAATIALSLLSGVTEARRFKDEMTNRALKNTRRVQ